MRTILRHVPASSIRKRGQFAVEATDDCLDVSIVIVNYNGAEFLVDALQRTYDSVRDSLLKYRIILVDNDSGDGSAGLAQTRFPELQVVALENQVGFAAANNIGVLNASPSEFVLFLNPDAWLCPGTLERMVDFLRNHSEYGAVAPVEQRRDGKVRRTWWPYPTPVRLLLDLLYQTILYRWFPKSNVLEMESKQWKELAFKPVIGVPYLPGYCLLVRFSAFHRVGRWDEQYPFYVEDADLGYRLACDGWRLGIVTSAFSVHIGSASTNASPMLRAEMLWKARILFCHKHFRDEARLVRALAHMFIRLVPQRADQLRLALQQLATGPDMDFSTTVSHILNSKDRAFEDANKRQVSVIIPSYGRIEGLKMVLSSYLQAAFVAEVIVVLDGSAEVPDELVSTIWPGPLRPRFLAIGRRSGQPACRNIGVQVATQNLVLFGEDDVTIEPDYVARLLDATQSCHADMAAGRCVRVRWGQSLDEALALADWRVGQPIDRKLIQADFSMRCPDRHLLPFLHSIALMPRDLAMKVGFDAEYRGNQYREETDFYMRAKSRGAAMIWDNDAICYHHRGGPFMAGGQHLPPLSYLLWTILNNHRFVMKNRDILETEFGIRNPWLASSYFALVWARNFLRTTASPLVPASLRASGK